MAKRDDQNSYDSQVCNIFEIVLNFGWEIGKNLKKNNLGACASQKTLYVPPRCIKPCQPTINTINV